MSRAFRRSSPNLHNSEYIRNKKSKVMYNHMVNVAVNNKCSSSDGKNKIDCSGYLLHTNNQETLNLLRYGSALCAPCDISGLVTEPGDISGVLDKCACRIPMSQEVYRVLYNMLLEGIEALPAAAEFFPPSKLEAVMNMFGMGPDFFYLPWNPFEKPGGHNAERIYWTPPCDGAGLGPSGNDCKNTPITFYLQDSSSGRFGGCPFGITNAGVGDASGNANVLPFIDASGDCSGATCGPTLVNIYGAYMNIFDIDANFGNTCGSTYLPTGTFAFKLKDVLSAWLYLWEPILVERLNATQAFLEVVTMPIECDAGLGLAVWAYYCSISPSSCSSVAPTYVLYLMVCWFHGLGIYAARPPTTIDNYLSNFAQNTPLRIYRSKH